MKWTTNERFPNDKVGTIKDEISDKMKGVGARFGGFVSNGSGRDESTDLRQRGKDDIVRSQDLSKEVVMDTGKANHDTVQSESEILDKDIVSTPESIGENIANQAMASTSISKYIPLEIGSLKIERRDSYYSHLFSSTPVIVTNRGCIQVSGKNFDYIHIIQRN